MARKQKQTADSAATVIVGQDSQGIRRSRPAAITPEVVATVGQRVRAAREKKGWTRYKLANLAGITPFNVDKLEKGGDLRVSTLLALALVLEVQPGELVDGLPGAV